MNHSTILKTVLVSVAFAFCLNTASAQESAKKAKKTTTEERVTQSKSLDAAEKEPRFKYVYSMATVINAGDKYIVEFEESRTDKYEATARRNKEMSAKMQNESNMPNSETDLMNSLAEQNLELISVTNYPGKEGKMMKYYFRTKVEY